PVRTDLPLKDYQRAGVRRLEFVLNNVGGALLADDMGLGKTLQTIALANHMGLERMLVVCPRFMSYGWLDELEKWGEHSHVLVTSGSTKWHKTTMLDFMATSKWV